MTFCSIEFMVLFCATAFLAIKCQDVKKQQIILLVASYIFYSWWDIRFLGLLVFQTYISYIFALFLERTADSGRRKSYCIVGVTILLVILGVFKYYNFFLEGVCNFIGREFIAWDIVLPIGISFYTFQAISYIIDVYRKTTPVQRKFYKVALYISFFPQLVAGPIVRANDFLPQLEYKHSIKLKNVESALQIFLFGLFKKIVIADRLAVCVDAVFAAPSEYDAMSVLCAVIAYSLQIYCDFSGYSDMAIGVAKFFDYDLCRNFNMPYISKNPTEFWKRWHISLSVWLQDYLYISMGGNRKGKIRTYVNLMITMILGGLWHGADETFVIWGLMHGMALIVHKVFLTWKKEHCLPQYNKILQQVLNLLSMFVTYVYVCIGWIFFRAESYEQAIKILRQIVIGADGIHYIYSYTVIYGILVLICYLVGWLKGHGDGRYLILNLSKFWNKVVLCVIVGIIMVFSYQGDNAFIYFQF